MDGRVLVVVTIIVALAGCGGSSLPVQSDATQTATPGTDAREPRTAAGDATPTTADDPGVPADSDRWEATVTRVVDGDTVEVRYGNGTTDTVRLVGVDAPETRGDTDATEFEGVPGDERGQACLSDAGDDATDALATWLNRTASDGSADAGDAAVTLVADPSEGPRDRYDRLLAYVVRDDANLNYRLVAAGHARVYDTDFALADAFYAAEATAQEDGRNLWACADGEADGAGEATDAGDGDLRVRVNEDAPGNDHENRNGEYVVLTNAGDEPLDVGGWTVADEADHTYTFPEDATIPPDESVRLHSGAGADNETAYFWDADGAVWNNDGDTVFVRDENGTLVAEQSY